MSVEELVKYRIERSKESFAASKELISDGFYYDATSRLYFSCFYILLAYFHAKQLKAETHKGVRILFHQELIKTSLIHDKYSRLYGKLFNRRFESDYAEFIHYEKEDVEPLIDEVEEFIKVIEALIDSIISRK